MNEAAKKAANPNAPYTPDEIIADALACAKAGAAIVHFHGRNADGSESSRAEDFRAVLAGVRAGSDLTVHPTLGRFRGGAGPEERLSNIEELSLRSNLKPDIAPLDMGSNNVDFWDAGAADFSGGGFVYANSTADLRLMAGRLRDWGVKPQLAIWSVPNLRLMGAFIEAGLVAEPAFAVVFLAGERFLGGHPATSAGLRAYVDNLPKRRVAWSVMAHEANLLPLVPEIIGLGGHVSIGLGDYAYRELGAPTNADLVRRVVEIARAMGREVATPAEARAMLNITDAPKRAH